MSSALDLPLPIWKKSDRALVEDLDKALVTIGSRGAFEMRALMRTQARHVTGLGDLVTRYPSLFATQILGSGDEQIRRRNVQTLVDTLATTTPFTLDMHLPMRAISGKSYIMARLNFFRLLRHIVEAELTDYQEGDDYFDRVDAAISRCVFARVVEELLTSVVCDNTLDNDIRSQAALGLTHLWEDRLHFPMREFFPVLEHTWEARRRIRVSYGTLAGTSELFALMSEGCDPEFIQYFSVHADCEDEIESFREFLFGLSTEELSALEKKRMASEGVVGAADAEELHVEQIQMPPDVAGLPTEDRPVEMERPHDPATLLFSFFMKRHLEAIARLIGNLPGPKRTAEEYILLNFLKSNDPEIFGEPLDERDAPDHPDYVERPAPGPAFPTHD